MRTVNVTLQEAKEFILSLTKEETADQRWLRWDLLFPRIAYIQGYRDRDGRLIGISGLCRKYLTHSTFQIVTQTYCGKGVGTKMFQDLILWSKTHHIPCLITEYNSSTIAVRKMLRRIGNEKDLQVKSLYCYITPTTRVGRVLKPLLVFLIFCYYLLVKKGFLKDTFKLVLLKLASFFKSHKIGLSSGMLKLAACFIDYEAESIPPDSRLVEYGYTLSKLAGYPRGKVLDVGCIARHNYMNPMLSFSGWEVWGMDIRTGWRFQHPNFHFIKEDIRKNSFSDNTFDTITCISTLEHIGLPGYYGNTEEELSGDKHAVQEILRVLKPGGNLLLTIPYCYHNSIQPGERIYNMEDLEKLLVDFIILDKIIYVQEKDEWLITDENIRKEAVICLELLKR